MTATTKVISAANGSKPRSALRYLAAIAALLVVLIIELVVPARRQSAAYDEGCHAFAGYTYWTRGDFGVNPEHPPAVKLLATVPLLGKQLRYPPPSPVPFFKVICFSGGRDFIYSNVVDADALLFRSRMAAATLTLLAAILTFALGYEALGPFPARFGLLLFVFEPNLLAHGSLITTDMGITAFLLATVYAFYRYVKKPSAVRLVLTGLAAGLALATKFSGVLVLPILALLALVEISSRDSEAQAPGNGRLKHAIRLAGALVVIGVISLTVLWSLYGFRYAARPAGETMSPSLPEYVGQLNQPQVEKLMLFVARHHLLPEAYLFGFADVFITPRYMTSYVFGNIYRHGQWFYYPGALIIKTTLGLLFLLLIVFPFLLATRRGPPRRELSFLVVPAVVYFAAAMKSNFNIGVRHILPVYPFFILSAAFSAWSLVSLGKRWKYTVVALLLLSVFSSMRTFPNYLPYSNEAWGGPSKTYKWLTDSNVDWGQQLKQAKAYLDENGIKDCWFDYLGQMVSDPAYYKIPCKPLQTASGFANVTPPHISGTVLISATDLSPALWGPGELNPYVQFQHRVPDGSIANGIFVFRGEFDVPMAAAAYHANAAFMLLNATKPTAAQFSEAVSEAEAATRLAPDLCIFCFDILGDALTRLNRKDEAHAAYQQALTLAERIHPEFQIDEIAALKKKLQP